MWSIIKVKTFARLIMVKCFEYAEEIPEIFLFASFSCLWHESDKRLKPESDGMLV